MSEKKYEKRTRNWATIVYPESAPVDWIDKLADLKIPALVSPLHDCDVNANGEVKKAHYHVVMIYGGVKSSTQAKAAFDVIGGVGAEYVQSLRGYSRYLCHLDNPEKHQYSPADVRAFCGVDYSELSKSSSDKKAIVKQMLDYCRVNNITEFAELGYYAMDNEEEWYELLMGQNPMLFIKEVLKSMAFMEAKKGAK